MDSFAVIMPAAGRSVRFGADKLMSALAGRPVLAHSLSAFLDRRDVASIVIPCRWDEAGKPSLQEAPEPVRRLLLDPRVRLCQGGECRAGSVMRGLEHLPDGTEWVAVHDAARPLVSADLITRTFAAAREHGAAVPAMPVHLTIKQAQGPLPAKVQATIPRSMLWAMQTPQIMRAADLVEAFGRCPVALDEVTDDAQVLELAGREVWLAAGEERNLKITTALDLRIAEMMLAQGM